MKYNFNERVHDKEGRDLLRTICIGNGLDIGSADRPICENALRIDINPEYKPNILCDMSNIPLEDNSQDFIVASHVLEHSDNTIGCLKEWIRLLKPNSKIGILVPHGEFVDYIDLGDSSLTHRTLFTEKTLELFLKHIGFKEVEVKRIERPLAYNKSPAIIAFAVK